MLTHVWIIPAIMAVSFLIILLIGKRLPEKATLGHRHRRGRRLLRAVGLGRGASGSSGSTTRPGSQTSAVAAANTQPSTGRPLHTRRPGPGCRALVEQRHRAAGRIRRGRDSRSARWCERITWFQVDGVHFELGTLVDGLSVMMLFTVTLISLLVHIYSTEYLHGDRRFTHYYAFLSLFTAAMLFYVIVVEHPPDARPGWELVGVCSFVLIGHWWEEKRNTDAALKAFLTNRVGDVGPA